MLLRRHIHERKISCIPATSKPDFSLKPNFRIRPLKSSFRFSFSI